MRPLGIVIPWFGHDLKGGAEQLTWQAARRLAGRGHRVEVLTTCCRAFAEDWGRNHLRAGLGRAGDVRVRRFPVDGRDAREFGRVNGLLLGVPAEELRPGRSPAAPADSAAFARENINSSALLDHLRAHADDYAAFVFIPYLYGVILNGLPLVAGRTFLQPCLHDEAYAYLPAVARVFRLARGLLYNSEGEGRLAQRLYGDEIAPKGVVVGSGIETDVAEPPRPPRADLPPGEFVLCLGRRDVTKNTDLLVEAYADYRARHPEAPLRLVLAGPGNGSYGGRDGVIDLGLVGEAEKQWLLANCRALFQPSRNESYSRVIMEAWFHGRPAAAHRDCLATAAAVSRAEGGWLAATPAEWAETFALVARLPAAERDRLGAHGRRYAEEHASWERVLDRYEAALGLPRPFGTEARDRWLDELPPDGAPEPVGVWRRVLDGLRRARRLAG